MAARWCRCRRCVCPTVSRNTNRGAAACARHPSVWHAAMYHRAMSTAPAFFALRPSWSQSVVLVFSSSSFSSRGLLPCLRVSWLLSCCGELAPLPAILHLLDRAGERWSTDLKALSVDEKTVSSSSLIRIQLLAPTPTVRSAVAARA